MLTIFAFIDLPGSGLHLLVLSRREDTQRLEDALEKSGATSIKFAYKID